MDKVELSNEDMIALLEWRDEHKNLVRSLPAPLKAVEIICKDSGYRIKGIRTMTTLELTVFKGYENLGRGLFDIREDGVLVKKKGKYKFNEENFKSCLTTYCSVMALMTFGNDDIQYEPCQETRTARKASNKPSQRHLPRTTYILRRTAGTNLELSRGSHASPRGIFSVRGHYRHYKSGKVIWIPEYKKGTGKKKSKTYKVGGKLDERNT